MTTSAIEITAEQRRDILFQIPAISDGIELPVSAGYSVRIHLTGCDDYTVERVFKRGAKEWIKGRRVRVYCDQLSEAAYRASCFRSYGAKEW